MNKTSTVLFAIPVLVLIAFSSTVLISNDVMAEENGKIPAWVKGVFGFYADGNIGDDELIQGLQFLISNGVIEVESQETAAAQCADTSEFILQKQQMQNKISELENLKQQFLGDRTLEEYLEDQEKAATSHAQAIYNESQKCVHAVDAERKYKQESREYSEAYWAEVEKVEKLEKEIEELKAQIQELQN